MTNPRNVAAYILDAVGEEISSYRLQKLLYYADAWFLVANGERPLFAEAPIAYENGPLIYSVWKLHERQFKVAAANFAQHRAELSTEEMDVIDEVLRYYGRFSTKELVDRTHAEAPYKEAWAKHPHNTRMSISLMREFYSEQLVASDQHPAIRTLTRTYLPATEFIDLADEENGEPPAELVAAYRSRRGRSEA